MIRRCRRRTEGALATATTTLVGAVAAAVAAVNGAIHRARCEEDGQATTEYALVLLGAALIALLVVGWATTGGGAGRIGDLFNRVIDSVSEQL